MDYNEVYQLLCGYKGENNKCNDLSNIDSQLNKEGKCNKIFLILKE